MYLPTFLLKTVELGYFCCDDHGAAAGYRRTLLPAVQQVITSRAAESEGMKQTSKMINHCHCFQKYHRPNRSSVSHSFVILVSDEFKQPAFRPKHRILGFSVVLCDEA